MTAIGGEWYQKIIYHPKPLTKKPQLKNKNKKNKTK